MDELLSDKSTINYFRLSRRMVSNKTFLTLLILLTIIVGGIIGYIASTITTATKTKAPPVTLTPPTVTETVTLPPTKTKWYVGFSPRGGCADLLIDWIDRANRSIYVMIYSFTRDDVSQALIDAKDRDIEVKIIM